jgi:hypothetical protein
MKKFSFTLILLLTTLSTSAVDQDKVKFYAEVDKVCHHLLPALHLECELLIDRFSKDDSVKGLLLLARAKEGIAFRETAHESHKDKGKELNAIYQRIFEKDPTIMIAIQSLAWSSPRAERIALFKKAILVEPHNIEVLKSLSNALSRGTPAEYAEGLEILKKGYPGIASDNDRRRLGYSYYSMVQRNPLGSPEQTSIARMHVLDNTGVNLALPDYPAAIGSITANCHSITLLLNARQACFNGLKLIMEHGRRNPVQLTADIPVVLSSLSTLLPVIHRLQQSDSNQDVQLVIRGWFEDIKATGENSFVFHLNYSKVLTGLPKIVALRNAVAAERKLPDFKGPGKTSYTLANALARAGFDDEAAGIAKDLKDNGVRLYRGMAKYISKNNTLEIVIVQ